MGRYTTSESGALPIMALASLPTATTLFSGTATATTDGSLSTIPRPGTYTSVFAVPRSIPSFFTKIGILILVVNALNLCPQARKLIFNVFIPAVNLIDVMDDGLAVGDERRNDKRKTSPQIRAFHFAAAKRFRPVHQRAMRIAHGNFGAHARDVIQIFKPPVKNRF